MEGRVKTTAPGTVRLTVDDLPAVQQESDGEAVFALTLDNARLWTPETPNLYTCRVSFADDVVTETFGVRKDVYKRQFFDSLDSPFWWAVFFALSNLHIRHMIRLSILPMPQAVSYTHLLFWFQGNTA